MIKLELAQSVGKIFLLFWVLVGTTFSSAVDSKRKIILAGNVSNPSRWSGTTA